MPLHAGRSHVVAHLAAPGARMVAAQPSSHARCVHAPVRRVHVPGHQRHAHRRQRPHRPLPQHLDVRVPAAHQHQVLRARVRGGAWRARRQARTLSACLPVPLLARVRASSVQRAWGATQTRTLITGTPAISHGGTAAVVPRSPAPRCGCRQRAAQPGRRAQSPHWVCARPHHAPHSPGRPTPLAAALLVVPGVCRAAPSPAPARMA